MAQDQGSPYRRMPRRPEPQELRTGETEPDDPHATDLAPYASTGGISPYTVEGEITQLGNFAAALRQRRGPAGVVVKLGLLFLLLIAVSVVVSVVGQLFT